MLQFNHRKLSRYNIHVNTYYDHKVHECNNSLTQEIYISHVHIYQLAPLYWLRKSVECKDENVKND